MIQDQNIKFNIILLMANVVIPVKHIMIIWMDITRIKI